MPHSGGIVRAYRDRPVVKRRQQEMPPQPEKKPEPPAPSPGVEFADVLKSDFPTSRGCKNPPQEVEETGVYGVLDMFAVKLAKTPFDSIYG